MGLWGTNWMFRKGTWADKSQKVEMTVETLNVGKDGEAGHMTMDGLGFAGTKTLTADTTLTAADAGDILLDAVGEAITLPAPTAGLRYRFLITEAPATSDWVITATDALVDGSVTEAGLVQLQAGETTLTIANANALKGDWLELYSNGTRWFSSGQFSVAASFTTA